MQNASRHRPVAAYRRMYVSGVNYSIRNRVILVDRLELSLRVGRCRWQRAHTPPTTARNFPGALVTSP